MDNQDLDDELRSHLELEVQQNIDAGMTLEEARQAALRKFGDVTLIKERTRAVWGIAWLETLKQDIRYALRTLRRSPGFTLVAVLSLALGIGANTAIFSVVNAVLLRSLPYRNPDRLAMLWTVDSRQYRQQRTTGYLNIQDWADQSHAFEEIGFYQNQALILAGSAEPESVVVSFASPNLFSLLGGSPALGRTFNSDEASRGDRVAVISHALWQTRFAGSPDVIGKTVELDSLFAQVIGVMPAGFQFPNRDVRLWTPHTTFPFWSDTKVSRASKFGWMVVGRLRPGESFRQAQAEMDTIAARLREHPLNEGLGVAVVPLDVQLTQNVRFALKLLLGAVAFVLLISCANVANLLLARGNSRQRELAIRQAIGAGRGRLIRQLLTESSVLALVSGAAGAALASAGLGALLAAAPDGIPRLEETSIDLRVIVFTMAISLAAGILFGLAPAFQAVNLKPSRYRDRLRGMLVVAQFALAMVLVTGAGLLGRSFIALQAVDPGFRPEHVLTVGVSLLQTMQAQTVAYHQRVIERLEKLPGVEAAGAISRYFQQNIANMPITVRGRASFDPTLRAPVSSEVIAGNYLQALRVPLVSGRFFSAQDGPDAPKVAIINQAMARTFFPGEDPIGKVFARGTADVPRPDWYTIVGVVGDMRRQTLDKEPIPEIFWPHAQRPWAMSLVIRTTSDPLAMAAAIRSEIRSIDSNAVIEGITTLERRLDERISQRRFQTWLLGLFSALALLLAAMGIYGVLHYAVAQRTQEIGIRMALGARPEQLRLLFARQGLELALAGVVAGAIGALWLGRLLSGLVYGITTSDPATFAGVAALLVAVALLAGYIPARRATKIDPLLALRHD